MLTTAVPRYVRRLTRVASSMLVIALFLGTLPESASAASSWSPTLLVNTESFQIIDAGDGTTDIELRFGSSSVTLKFLNASQKFQFTRSLSVLGGLSGSYLTIDQQANISGSLTVKGATSLQSTLGVTGNVTTDANLTINNDAGATDAVLTFGNASGNQSITFLNTAQKFKFSKDISVTGNISGSTLTIDGAATVQSLSANGVISTTSNITAAGNISAAGSLSGSTFYGAGLGSCNGTTQKIVYNSATGKFQCATDQDTATPAWSNTGSLQNAFDARYVNTSGDTMTGALNVRANLSGSSLTVDGTATVQNLSANGTATVNGSITTNSNLTINGDSGATDAVLTFGNASGNQSITFLNTAQKFKFSKDISVQGNISGSTLTVDGALTLHGVSYNAPSAQGGANTFLKNDGAGNLTWAATSVGNGSGGILSLHPEYPNAIYFSSGSSYIGQMTMSGGTSALENSYVWTSSRSGLQNYWISVRVRLPDNFSAWDPVKPVELRYKTGVTGTTNNVIKVMMRDTAGAYRALTGGEALSSTTWTTANITGPEAGGTWSPKGYATVYIKLAANSTAGANAAVGYLNFNFETTTP